MTKAVLTVLVSSSAVFRDFSWLVFAYDTTYEGEKLLVNIFFSGDTKHLQYAADLVKFEVYVGCLTTTSTISFRSKEILADSYFLIMLNGGRNQWTKAKLPCGAFILQRIANALCVADAE